MRVRSSAASASGELGAGGGQRRFGPGRRRQAIGGERLAQGGARLLEPLPGLGDAHRAPCRRRHRSAVPARRALQRRSNSSRLCASWRSALATLSSAVRRSCAALPGGSRCCRGRACAPPPRQRRHCTRADQLLVVEAHQQIAGDDLVVERDQHLGDAARRLRADAHLAAGRLDAARAPRPPTPLLARAPSAWRTRRPWPVGIGLDGLGRLGAEGLRHVVADAERQRWPRRSAC